MRNLNQIFKFNLLALVALSVVVLSSCKDEGGDPIEPTPSTYQGAFILNEGGFLKGNASIDFYSRGEAKLTQNLFSNINSRPLGDIFQSMYKVNNNYYLVVNNSSKIEVVNTETFKSVGTISNLGSPRFMLVPSASNGTKAYVTDLFNNVIHVISLTSNTQTKTINLNGWSENLVEAGGNVYVNNWSNKKVYVIDPSADAVKDSVELTDYPNGIVVDANKKVWVLVDSTATTPAKLVRINPSTNTIEGSIDFAAGETASKLAINGAGDKLYYLNNTGVFEVAMSANTLPTTAKKAGSFYGLGIDPIDGSIYLGDAIDFNQNGTVTRIKADGSETTFKVGIVPGGFFFNN